MKLMSKFEKLFVAILIGFIIGFIGYLIYSSQTIDYHSEKNINGVIQEFPIKLSNDYKIIDAKLTQHELTVIILNNKDGYEYESTLPSEDIEDFVCNTKYYNAEGKYNIYDCSTEENIVKAMILELGKQTIEIIEGE